ncbi:hypothetical protein [Enterobacillus tribolii]|uniref:Uncharacterized protein n=1 Tax=Enterobacillus tribolii TaxID=1487935 RepID=A0A370R280_9GAMM|nr:hypothetical protein [Enterobacillus tribolii]MBW7984829.1 hypothetical protein [Enterobacillus tribolii]RDK96021.1 hypothetical protein C8D90_102508 [Enterobacillus tribolii]
MPLLSRPLSAVWITLLISLSIFILWCLMPSRPLIDLVGEGNIVETLTLYLYGITILCFCILPVPGLKKSIRFAVAVILLYMMAREADLHKSIAQMSMLKLRFWSGSLPWEAKVSALLILLPITAACLYLIVTCWRSLRDAIRGRRNYAISAGMFILLIIITNIIDRSVSVIKKWTGFIPPDWVVALQTSQEEFLELWLPALALLALLQFQHRNAVQETKRVRTIEKRRSEMAEVSSHRK